MEEDEEKDTEILKPKVEKLPSSNVSVPKCCLFREIGCKQKNNRVPVEFQLAAEENLITRDHEEFRCHLPDVTRSTFLMVFSPDGKKVASTHGNHNVYVTDLTSGKNIKTLTGHPRTPWCIAFHPSSNQILASGCLGGQVRVWDLHGGSEIWTAESQTVIASLAFHPVDRMLVIASYNELHFWDWSQPEPFAKCYTANEKEKVRYVAFDQLGHKLITGVANAPSRGATMWDRVAAPQPPPQTTQSDQERCITNYRYNTTPICYRYMVEQYEQLVQRYYDLSRARTMPTMDRGTDPMDLEVESSRNAETSTAGPSSSTSRSGTNSRLDSLRVSTANLRMTLNTENLTCSPDISFTSRVRPQSFFSRSSSSVQQSESSDSNNPQQGRSQSHHSATSENGHPVQGRTHFSRLPVVRTFVRVGSSNSSLPNEPTTPPTRYIAGTDERTASRSSSQHLSTEPNLRHPDSTCEDTSHDAERNISPNQSDSLLQPPSEANSEDSSQSSSVESVRIRRVHAFRNLEQSECSTSNSENVSHESSGRQASPRSSTSLSVSLRNLGFVGSQGESFDNGSEVSPQEPAQPTEEPFIIRPLGLPPESIGFNIRQSGSQAGSEDSDVIIPNVGSNSSQRGSGVRVRRRRLFHVNMNFSDESTLSSSQHNSPDDINNDISNLERSAAQLLSRDLNREQPNPTSRPSPPNIAPSATNRGYQRFFCEPVSDEPFPQSPVDTIRLDALRARQRNLEDSFSSLSTSWERFSASFQQRSNTRNTGGNSSRAGEGSGSGSGSSNVGGGGGGGGGSSSGAGGGGAGGGGGGGGNSGERDRNTSLGERDAVSRLRRRLSAYRSHTHTQAHTQRERLRECQVLSVLSAESEAAERQLLNRLNEILERPLPERPRRFFVSRRSAFQQARSSSSTSQQPPQPPRQPEIGGVRYGIELLSRHIDNMQRLCRARLEILQLQQIRRMWEDLQSQIYALHGTVREVTGNRGGSRSTSGSRGSRSSGGENPGSSGVGAATTFASSTSRAPRESSDHIVPSHSSRSDGDDADSGHESDQGQDLITDDESDGGTEEQPEERTRSPFLPFRRFHRFSLQRSPRLLKRYRPGTISYRANDGIYRRTSQVQNPGTSRRPRTNPIQYMGRGEWESESSNVSGDSSTTSERGGLGAHPRGLKRKTRETRETERPRGSVPVAGPSTSSDPSSHRSFAESMRETIMQLESMVWRQRERTALRNLRMTRFTRQREERMLRNLWDTESSHESGRDDMSEGDSSQRNTAPEDETTDGDWSRETTRRRARQILLVMVDSLTQFFEQDSLSRRQTNEALHDRIYNLYVLLQLALNLTDLLLAQLVTSRRELESRRLNLAAGGSTPGEGESWASRCAGRSRQHMARHWRQPPETWRRAVRRDLPPIPHPPARDSRRSQPTTSGPSGGGSSSGGGGGGVGGERGGGVGGGGGGSRGLPHRHQAVYSNIRSAMLAHRLSVPIVRVNDLPAPDPPLMPPRPRPPSPPLPFNPFSRLLSSSYGRNSNPFDDSSEESSPQDHRSESFLLMRAGYGPTSDLLTDTLFSMAPNHRIQAWDFSTFNIPDISNPEKNLVVNECRIHNDASVDVSSDGHLLVTLLPSGRLSMLGVYSLQWATLGQLLYRTSFEQNAVSVSLSPTTRHLVVGLASRRVAYTTNPERQKHTIAQIFRLEGAKHGGSSQGRLELLRNLELNWNLGYMSLNCIRWAPNPGQGLVYGTNTGQLKLLR